MKLIDTIQQQLSKCSVNNGNNKSFFITDIQKYSRSFADESEFNTLSLIFSYLNEESFEEEQSVFLEEFDLICKTWINEQNSHNPSCYHWNPIEDNQECHQIYRTGYSDTIEIHFMDQSILVTEIYTGQY